MCFKIGTTEIFMVNQEMFQMKQSVNAIQMMINKRFLVFWLVMSLATHFVLIVIAKK